MGLTDRFTSACVWPRTCQPGVDRPLDGMDTFSVQSSTSSGAGMVEQRMRSTSRSLNGLHCYTHRRRAVSLSSVNFFVHTLHTKRRASCIDNTPPSSRYRTRYLQDISRHTEGLIHLIRRYLGRMVPAMIAGHGHGHGTVHGAARHGAVQGELRHGGRGCGPKTGAKRVGGGDREARRIRRRIKRRP